MLKQSKLNRGRLRAATALATATGTIAAMILLAVAPAQAATTARVTPVTSGGLARASSQAQTDGSTQIARKRIKTSAPAGGRAAVKGAGRAEPGVRPVCAAAKPRHAACMALVRTNIAGHLGLRPADSAPSGYGPSDLQSAYNLPSASAGSGQTVAIVDAYDDPTAEADLQTYRAQYGLPVCDTANGCFEKVNQDGQQGDYPQPDYSWAGEISLDLDMVSAICPNCHILLVEANSNGDSDLDAAEDEAVALGAKYVSNSWGGSEYSGEQQEDPYFDHPGVAITFAGGDSGYGVNWPAASQYVTAVGGTSLTRDSSVPRGWTESVWSTSSSEGTGSGCSASEPKPSWQTDTGCANRTTNDVSAVADPYTGVAVYDSYEESGWQVYGGTSVATPIIASVYALAGTPVAGSYPSSYPYANPSSALNDVTTGSTASCTPAYLCTAGPGYDGPTGLGTPDGVGAFVSPGPHGDISGQVTDTTTGQPVANATISTAGGYTATTNSQGDYDLTAPVGSYNLTVQAYGYNSQTEDGVQVSQGQTSTENIALTAIPRYTISGTVTAAGGHKWPLYAKISISGYPGGPIYTNPYTGTYSISLPENTSYTLQAIAVNLSGYKAGTATVDLGTADATQNIQLGIDQVSCSAPGYGFKVTGTGTGFEGWTGTTPEDGWTDTAINQYKWRFSDPNNGLRNPSGDNQTGGSGNYALINSNTYGFGVAQTASLTSPVVNLSRVSSPEIGFDTAYVTYFSRVSVEVSLDGGQSWTTLWHHGKKTSNQIISAAGFVKIPIPQAAGQSDVRVRFHFSTSRSEADWELDNVFIGTEKCTASPGGLLAGQVTDANTGASLGGATVVSNLGGSAATAASAGDADQPGGLYEFFTAQTGNQQLTATDGAYTANSASVNVTANAVTHQDFALHAGQLTVTPAASATVSLGGSTTRNLTLHNSGTEPVQVSLDQQNDGFTPVSLHNTVKRGQAASAGARLVVPPESASRQRQSSPDAKPWVKIRNLPISIQNNAVVYDPDNGDVYTFDGYTPNLSPPAIPAVTTNVGYAYNPTSRKWTVTAPVPVAMQLAVAAFADGKIYLLSGGSAPLVPPQGGMLAYSPPTNTWSQTPSMPQGAWAPSVAVLAGDIYVIGGCTSDWSGCDAVSTVWRFNPASNTWTQLANYPVPVSQAACAGINSELVCAGGVTDAASYDSTYIYDPATNTWSQGADMPYFSYAADYAGANNQLQVFGGVVNNSNVSNLASEYNPVTNTWSTLPSADYAEYDGGGSCGLYQIGGDGAGNGADTLPGYDQCGSSPDTPWLSQTQSTVTIPPGGKTTVTVRMDSSALTQPGTYTAKLDVGTNTPYPDQWVNVSFTVKPPKSWGEINGTVTSASTGNPIAGATVQICTQYVKSSGTCGSTSYTLTTGSNGYYQLWLNQGDNPLQISAAKNGYQPQARVAKITKETVTTVNPALNPD